MNISFVYESTKYLRDFPYSWKLCLYGNTGAVFITRKTLGIFSGVKCKIFNCIDISTEPVSNTSVLLNRGTDQYFLNIPTGAWLGHDLISGKVFNISKY